MSYETDFDSAFTILLGKAAGIITPAAIQPTPTTGSTPGITGPLTAGIEFVIDGGGAALSTGSAGGVVIPFDCEITEAEIQEFEGTSGSITLDIQKGTAGPSPSFSSITGGVPPFIGSGRHYSNTTLANWTTTLSRGEVLRYVVSSVSSFTRLTIALYVRHTDVGA